ncbi:MAG: type II secretion system F family protein [Bacillota bacterium]
MEGVAPPLALLLCVKRILEKGQPVKQGVLYYLKRHDGEFAIEVSRWMALLQQGKDTQGVIKSLSSQYRQVLLQLLERGMRGESVYAALQGLEVELVEACEEEITNKLARLPFLLLVPLLLFQFPAFLMLLFGPLLQNFFHSLGGG